MEKQQIQQIVQQKLNISAEQYAMLMYEYGEDYFEIKCGGWTNILNAFRKSKALWNWWINQYYIMDEALIHVENDLNIDLYRAFHVGMDYYPNECIVKRAMDEYDKVVQSEIKHAIH